MSVITRPDLTETSYLLVPHDTVSDERDLLLSGVGDMISRFNNLPGSSHKLEEVALETHYGGKPLFVSEVLKLDLRGTQEILAGLGKRLEVASSLEEYFARKIPN